MSTSDAADSSRLESALADVFSNAPSLPPRESARPPTSPAGSPSPPATDDDWGVDEPDDEPVELPEIVPATSFPVDPAARPATPPARPEPTPPTTPSTTPSTTPPAARATSWGDHMAATPAVPQGAQLRAPGRRPRVRRVTRVLRHVDPWSTFKVALLFSAVAYLVTLTSGVLLWRVADSTGTLDNVERWFTQFGWETFELKGDEIFQNAWVIGLFAAVALTGGLVLLATLFNLVSDIVGGVRMTVLEEEVVERTISSTRRYVVRRAPVPTDDAAADWDVDDGPDGGERSDGPATGSGPIADEPTARQRAVPNDDWSVDDDEMADPGAGRAG